MKRYDGLFILNSVGHEDSVDKMIDGVTASITDAGATIESIDRMETKSFARVANKRYKSGFYFSVIFEASIETLRTIQAALADNEDVFRSSIQIAAVNPVPEPAAAPAAE